MGTSTTAPPPAPAIWTPPPGWGPPPGAGWPPPPPGTWPARPTAVPPSCFSQLYALNQCYDDIQMMEQILIKVITNLVQTDPALMSAIVDAIAKSGSNVPLIGVTNGQPAQPGQVGEFIQLAQNVAYSAGNAWTGSGGSVSFGAGVLQPGDWDCWAYAFTGNWVTDFQVGLSPVPAGFSGSMVSGYYLQTGGLVTDGFVETPHVQALLSVPTLVPFELSMNTPQAGTVSFTFCARRMR